MIKGTWTARRDRYINNKLAALCEQAHVDDRIKALVAAELAKITSWTGHKIDDTIAATLYAVIQRETAITCPIIGTGIKHFTRHITRTRRSLGITFNTNLALPRSVINDLGLLPGEADDIRALLADPVFKTIAMGKAPSGIAGAIVSLYLYIRRTISVPLQDVANAFHVTTTCIRARKKEILILGGGRGPYWPSSRAYKRCTRIYEPGKIGNRILELLPAGPPGLAWREIRKASREQPGIELISHYNFVIGGLVKHGFVVQDAKRYYGGPVPRYWKVNAS